MVAHQRALDGAGAVVMAFALAHPAINPVNRYLEHRASFTAARKKFPQKPFVVLYDKLYGAAQEVFNAAVTDVECMCSAVCAADGVRKGSR